jgi:acyl dehydratase
MRIVNGLDELAGLVGTELGTSDWVAVTEQMVRSFADVTGDHQWIHLDNERAARELPTGGAIVHGFLTLSLVVQLQEQILTVRGSKQLINYGLNRVRFPAPLRVGSRVRATETLVAAERTDDAMRVTCRFVIEAEGKDKPVCVAETVMLAS